MSDIFTRQQNDYHRQLINRMQGGDQKDAADAFEEIYRIFHKIVLGKVMKVLPYHREFHDDLVSDVFLKIHTKKHMFDPAYNLNNWLMRLTHNLCIEFVRREKVRETIGIEEVQDTNSYQEATRYTEDTSVGLDKIYLRKVLEVAMDGLSDKKTNVMKLHYFDGLTMDEIAKVSNIKKSAVVDYLVIGRKHLKNKLTQDSIAQLVEH